MNDYYVKVQEATNEAMDAFHTLHPDIPRNLHPYIKKWGEARVDKVAKERLTFINQHMRQHHPELFK